ncbi:hypothetical protein GGI25_000407 [Coemansia spiralis]|uniref:Uncharacterized protein n=2 Tax=Coemansia TaxID=4863 RepID=A0A9W8L146_9FUNG|nr:hypothetical protein BX070DRAFT_221443 [Coemansia spiralis]KAJ1996344.1 hypothetical protein EDC05_000234 [Coemansia umbellata]KAJ2624192.1 hypothetical protein GGI26_001768 [Coemansia sp. RSA 1358]KAJ2680772.1 hypothetical protein GGI25_000407 [Coemansia spiralis]
MASPNDLSLISSYELVSRSLEDSIKYDNLSDAEKSRARKRRVRRIDRRTFMQRCTASIRNVDMFWALTGASICTFVLIALSLLYFRHSHLVFMHRFSHEELSSRKAHLGFDRIYVIERPAMHADASEHGERWAALGRELEIEFETWPVSIPTPLDPRLVLLHQRECWRPHLSIYRDIVSKGYMDALIIEDHVVFGPSPRLRLYSALMGIPADWDVLQLGPANNGTDSGHHDDIPIHGSQLMYRRVDDGACNNLAYAISHAGARKIVKALDSTHAHADFEHKLLDMLDRVKFLLFRVSPSIFQWRDAEHASA